jgi:hypothetical protein
LAFVISHRSCKAWYHIDEICWTHS